MSGIVRAFIFAPCITRRGDICGKKVILVSERVAGESEAKEKVDKWEDIYKSRMGIPEDICYEYIPDPISI